MQESIVSTSQNECNGKAPSVGRNCFINKRKSMDQAENGLSGDQFRNKGRSRFRHDRFVLLRAF